MAQGAPLHCDAGSCCAAVSLGLCTQQRVVYHSMCPLSPSTLQQGRPPLLPMRLQALPSPANTAMSPPGMMQDTACQLAFQQTPPSKLRPRAMVVGCLYAVLPTSLCSLLNRLACTVCRPSGVSNSSAPASHGAQPPRACRHPAAWPGPVRHADNHPADPSFDTMLQAFVAAPDCVSLLAHVFRKSCHCKGSH
jgi:hypothetical protein